MAITKEVNRVKIRLQKEWMGHPEATDLLVPEDLAKRLGESGIAVLVKPKKEGEEKPEQEASKGMTKAPKNRMLRRSGAVTK
jgi:hypothetical protein